MEPVPCMELVKLLSPWNQSTPPITVTGIKNNSRQIKKGDLFLAYPGALTDGRLFIAQAIEAGAVAVVYDPEQFPSTPLLKGTVPCIPLPQLHEKLAAIAARFYQYPSKQLHVTGVTGTNGKTSIAYQLAQAYGLLGEQAAYIGTLGQGIVNKLEALANTTPDGLCLQQLLFHYQQQGIRSVSMEVSSHALSLHRVDDIAFSHAIYTNLSHEHLDFHHNMEAYALAKASLFSRQTLKTAIINHDDSYADRMIKALPNKSVLLTYGLTASADVYTLDWQSTMAGSEIFVHSPWGQYLLKTKSLGQFNIYNSLAVFTSLLARGYNPHQVNAIFPSLISAPGRMELVSTTPCVIVDFAHTPDALKHVLNALNALKKNRLIVVFGCGGDRDKGKRQVMGRIASTYADCTIITSDNPRSEQPQAIVDEIAQGIQTPHPYLKITDRARAIAQALTWANADDIVLIAGKGHETYQQIGQERFYFSDKDVVHQLLNQVST